MTADNRSDIGKIIKQRRVMIPLSLKELAAAAGISLSHLSRIERGERFPSAYILRKIAKPLGFEEAELLTLGGFLSPQPAAVVIENASSRRLDPYVATVLAEEPAEIQRAIIDILSVTKSIAKSLHAYDKRNAEDQGRKS